MSAVPMSKIEEGIDAMVQGCRESILEYPDATRAFGLAANVMALEAAGFPIEQLRDMLAVALDKLARA